MCHNPDRPDRRPMRSYTSASNPSAQVAPTRLAHALRASALPFAASRIGVLAAGLAAAVIIGYDPPPTDESVWRVAADPVRNLLARWDAYWYLDIATRGYRWNGNPLEQQNVVFFPFYPLLMRTVGPIIGGHPLLAGLLVSMAAFAIALAYLRRWIAEDFGDDTATGSVLLLSAFPFSIFFSAVYTESLFLLTVVAALYHANRRELVTAAIFGLFAGLVRPNGCLLAVPLAWMLFVTDPHKRSAILQRSAAAAAPLAGMLLYAAYLGLAVGSPFAWIAGQAAWPTIAPWGQEAGAASAAMTSARTRDLVIYGGNALSLLLAIAALLPVARLVGVAYALFIALAIVPPVARHGLQSLGRFTSVLFPIFVWLAIVLRGRTRVWVVVVFAIGQIVAAALFFSWRPLM